MKLENAILDFEVGGMGLGLVFGMICGCEDMTLKETFLVLFGFACTKDAFVVAHMKFSRGAIQWNMIC